MGRGVSTIYKGVMVHSRAYYLLVSLLTAWVLIMLCSLKFGWLDHFFWAAAEHMNVQGIDYFALPKSFLNLLHHHSLYDSWVEPAFGRGSVTWYLAHPLFSVLIMSWFSCLPPWISYVAFLFFSLGIMGYCASLFAKYEKDPTEKLFFYALFLMSFPLYWMLYVGNMHAPLVLSLTLVFIAIYRLGESLIDKNVLLYNKQLALGLLCSLFSKPMVLLFFPALLMVKETRRTACISFFIYAVVSLLFIVVPFLNPEGVGLGKLLPVFFDHEYIKQTMNIYKNNFVLTPFMKDNSIHWFNLIAQSGYRLNHIENFSFPVFLDHVFRMKLPDFIYLLPSYFCFMVSFFVAFMHERTQRLHSLLLLLMTISVSYFLSYNTVWEYQFTSLSPVLAMIFLEKNKQFITKPQWIACMVSGLFFYLPSVYFLLEGPIDETFISLIHASRTLPVLLLFFILAYRMVELVLLADYQWPKVVQKYYESCRLKLRA